uniref:Transketolase n=1 Tax=uncultured bacterium UPO47 TaxID=1776972 RepID=A0A126SY72_9BACT|nr:transketolase 1 [uncultured bacterium UPO47]
MLSLPPLRPAAGPPAAAAGLHFPIFLETRMSLPRRQLANAIRALAMDAVEAAKSGHPGMPMGMADIAEALWNETLRHNPADPSWPDRDRFVVSNGHGSMLLYALLHLSGYELPLEELKRFRQLHSKTPGHPEYGLTPGVETTTGPLGQGLANAVGMALAERRLAAEFNRPGHDIVDHHTYVFVGDGCLMEGVSHEACSLAGTLGLGKLIVLYDDNGISIDGQVRGWFADDTPARFAAYGWQVIRSVDGHDADAVRSAIAEARADTARPSLICCRTVIGFGAPSKAGKASCHGAPLGADEIAGARAALGWPHAPFQIPADIYKAWDARVRGAARQADWHARFERYAADYPQPAADFARRMAGELPADFARHASAIVTGFQAEGKDVASRQASQLALDAFGPLLPELLGGSADLTESNLTHWKGARALDATQPDGQHLHYGVREFGMSAVMNGIALHGGLLPYGGTFLVFSDYARNALRMSALMRQRVVYVLTHDSIGLGEDGPTHQPVEQLSSLRLIPGLEVWRPCDAAETAVAWAQALQADGPTALALSRQKLPHQARDAGQLAAVERGGYVLADGDGAPQVILIATGSEVALVMAARARLAADGITARVVSMPSLERFAAQDAAYRDSVLPPAVTARVAVEAGVPDLWWRYVGSAGRAIGVARFGESAPAGELFECFGFTVPAVVDAARSVLANR